MKKIFQKIRARFIFIKVQQKLENAQPKENQETQETL